MLGIDTNVLVRILIRDDAEQFARAEELIRRERDARRPVLISLLVLLETEWVLRSCYKLSKAEILATLDRLLNSCDVCFEDESTVVGALFIWRDAPTQLADCLICLRYRELKCRATGSFDASALELPWFASV